MEIRYGGVRVAMNVHGVLTVEHIEEAAKKLLDSAKALVEQVATGEYGEGSVYGGDVVVLVHDRCLRCRHYQWEEARDVVRGFVCQTCKNDDFIFVCHSCGEEIEESENFSLCAACAKKAEGKDD